jgi:hypothetical protein
MKHPEQIPFDFAVLEAVPCEPPRAQVLQLADARARREAQVISAAYDAIFESIRHIDITRGRRMAEAREQVTHTR